MDLSPVRAAGRLQLAGRRTAALPELTDHPVELCSIDRNAAARAELQPIVAMADEAELSLTDVAPFHAALRLGAWLSTPSAQNSLQASWLLTRHRWMRPSTTGK
jgi:hypothetical protein